MRRRPFVTGLVLSISVSGCFGASDGTPADDVENDGNAESNRDTIEKDDEVGDGETDDENGGGGGDSEDGPRTPAETRPPVSDSPRDVLLKNYHDQEHTVAIRVTDDDESILEAEYELDAAEGDNIERIGDVIDEHGRYAITAELLPDERRATSEWTVTDESSNAVVYITDDGAVMIRPDQSI